MQNLGGGIIEGYYGFVGFGNIFPAISQVRMVGAKAVRRFTQESRFLTHLIEKKINEEGYLLRRSVLARSAWILLHQLLYINFPSRRLRFPCIMLSQKQPGPLLFYCTLLPLFFAVIVVFKVYEYCGNYGYTAIGLIVCVPCFLIPWLFPGEYDRQLPLSQRYWVKVRSPKIQHLT